jgi:hypothetical protein
MIRETFKSRIGAVGGKVSGTTRREAALRVLRAFGSRRLSIEGYAGRFSISSDLLAKITRKETLSLTAAIT